MTLREVSRIAVRRPLELAIQAAGLGEFEWDMDRDVFKVSPRMAAITGLAEGEMPARRGTAMDAYVHPDDREAVIAQRSADLAKGDSFDAEFRHIRPDDKRTIWLRTAGVI